jgi:hypothetical protein
MLCSQHLKTNQPSLIIFWKRQFLSSCFSLSRPSRIFLQVVSSHNTYNRAKNPHHRILQSSLLELQNPDYQISWGIFHICTQYQQHFVHLKINLCIGSTNSRHNPGSFFFGENVCHVIR